MCPVFSQCQPGSSEKGGTCHRLSQRGLPSPAQPRARTRPSKAGSTGWRAAGRALLSPSNFGPSVPVPRGPCSCGLDPRTLAGSRKWELCPLCLRSRPAILLSGDDSRSQSISVRGWPPDALLARMCVRSGGVQLLVTSPPQPPAPPHEEGPSPGRARVGRLPGIAGHTQHRPDSAVSGTSRGSASDRQAPWPLLLAHACLPPAGCVPWDLPESGPSTSPRPAFPRSCQLPAPSPTDPCVPLPLHIHTWPGLCEVGSQQRRPSPSRVLTLSTEHGPFGGCCVSGFNPEGRSPAGTPGTVTASVGSGPEVGTASISEGAPGDPRLSHLHTGGHTKGEATCLTLTPGLEPKGSWPCSQVLSWLGPADPEEGLPGLRGSLHPCSSQETPSRGGGHMCC